MLRVPRGTQMLDEDNETAGRPDHAGQPACWRRAATAAWASLLQDLDQPGAAPRQPGQAGRGALDLAAAEADRRRRAGRPAQRRQVDLPRGRLGAPSPRSPTIPSPPCIPNLGVVRVGDARFVLADIPGLIEGAYEGAGLGTGSWATSSAARVLIHLVDGTQDDVVGGLATIRARTRGLWRGPGRQAGDRGAQQGRRPDADGDEAPRRAAAKLANGSRRGQRPRRAIARSPAYPVARVVREAAVPPAGLQRRNRVAAQPPRRCA